MPPSAGERSSIAASMLRLSDELLGRIFGSVDDEERCRVIPLVCRRFLQIHREFTPLRREWIVPDLSISRPMMSWFVRIASSLKILDVIVVEGVPDFLPQMLALAAVCAPKLQCLNISLHSHQLWHSVALLTQIKYLRWDGAEFMEDDNLANGISHLSGLVSLKKLELQNMNLRNGTYSQAHTFWRALACLTTLSILHFHEFSDDERFEPGFRSHILQLLPMLQELRNLKLEVREDCLMDGRDLASAYSTLTRLTKLTLEFVHPVSSYAPFQDLPLLQRIRFMKAHKGGRLVPNNPVAFAPASRQLTHLRIRSCGEYTEVDSLLFPTAAALPTLRELYLENLGLQFFSSSLASRLGHLTMLQCVGNSFARLPYSLAQIPTLEHLNLSYNEDLRFVQSDVDTLAALTRLSRLKLVKSRAWQGKEWSAESTETLVSIARLFPNLEVQL